MAGATRAGASQVAACEQIHAGPAILLQHLQLFPLRPLVTQITFGSPGKSENRFLPEMPLL